MTWPPNSNFTSLSSRIFPLPLLPFSFRFVTFPPHYSEKVLEDLGVWLEIKPPPPVRIRVNVQIYSSSSARTSAETTEVRKEGGLGDGSVGSRTSKGCLRRQFWIPPPVSKNMTLCF